VLAHIFELVEGGNSSIAPHSIQVAGSAFQVVVKVLPDFKNALDMAQAKHVILAQSEALGRADCILDLKCTKLA
jgi:hypothetical protein